MAQTHFRFPTDFQSILRMVDSIDPIEYGRTRNYTDGAVTRLSPYISRGVISTKLVLERTLSKGFSIRQIEPFVKELCWRDYFQRVAQQKDLDQDIRHPQEHVSNHGIPIALLHAKTGIDAIDEALAELYETGYMHNHCRMYTAAIVCNSARSHWRHPAQWMYYHLLDGDWPSNACSWQWVAGCNSAKKYYANQENINTYTRSQQTGTFLDTGYEALVNMDIPESLSNTVHFKEATRLPSMSGLTIEANRPTFVYNYYNLDPLWHSEAEGNRILLIEPEFFSKYPVSDKCIAFMLALAGNINGIQVYSGSFDSLVQTYRLTDIYYKEHPYMKNYRGNEEARDWISKTVTEYCPSFFAYWKKITKSMIDFENQKRP